MGGGDGEFNVCWCFSSSEWNAIDSAEKDEMLCKMEDGEFWYVCSVTMTVVSLKDEDVQTTVAVQDVLPGVPASVLPAGDLQPDCGRSEPGLHQLLEHRHVRGQLEEREHRRGLQEPPE